MSNQPTFLRSVTTLFSGTVIAQAVPFLAAPVIARLYGPEQFAVFGTLMAVFNILNVVAAGRSGISHNLKPNQVVWGSPAQPIQEENHRGSHRHHRHRK